jgi:uncharacterized repeat protein (TIGR01451 family)
MASAKWLRFMAALAGLVLGGFAAVVQAGVGANATFTSKVFSPSQVAPGDVAVLTVTITNNTAAQLNGVTFTDTIPGLTGDGSQLNFISGCAALSSISINSGPPAVFSGTLNINASSACIVTAGVKSSTEGVFNNTTANITGWNGSALAFAPSQLKVLVPQAAIPTLSQFALVLLALGLGVLAYRRLRPARGRGGPPA